MPVLLAEKDFEPWLSGKAGLELLSDSSSQAERRLNGHETPFVSKMLPSENALGRPALKRLGCLKYDLALFLINQVIHRL